MKNEQASDKKAATKCIHRFTSRINEEAVRIDTVYERRVTAGGVNPKTQECGLEVIVTKALCGTGDHSNVQCGRETSDLERLVELVWGRWVCCAEVLNENINPRYVEPIS
jgi:hypothetical protein